MLTGQIALVKASGEAADRVPAWIRRAAQTKGVCDILLSIYFVCRNICLHVCEREIEYIFSERLYLNCKEYYV